jgi:hypothetical protein
VSGKPLLFGMVNWGAYSREKMRKDVVMNVPLLRIDLLAHTPDPPLLQRFLLMLDQYSPSPLCCNTATTSRCYPATRSTYKMSPTLSSSLSFSRDAVSTNTSFCFVFIYFSKKIIPKSHIRIFALRKG